jgi:beta-glucanase (GH16 family)
MLVHLSARGHETSVSNTRRRTTSFALALFSLLVVVAGCSAAATAATRFVVSSPTVNPSVPGNIAVRAQLKAKRSAGIVSAAFYVNGKRVTTDKRFPFKVKDGVKFDTRSLPAAVPLVRLSVVFKIRKSSGKLSTRTLKRTVRINYFVNPAPSVGAKGITPPPDPPVPTAFGYPLAFSDEFDGTSLNTSKWSRQRYDRLNLWTTNPLSHPYNGVEGAAYGIPNVTVADGALNLKLLNSKASGSDPEYTRSTGMVNSMNKFSFKYGYVETRVWVSDCIGCWPTFWIMPANNTWPPEIDIFEFVNPANEPKRFPHSIVHWKPDGAEGDTQHDHFESIDNDLSDGDMSQEWFITRPVGDEADYMGEGQWHTYGMLWTPTSVKFYVDGELGSEVVGETKLPQQPMYLIYQMAIGDPSQGPFGVAPAGSTLSVDYLHVFSANT